MKAKFERTLGWIVLFAALWVEPAEAQMFANRSVGPQTSSPTFPGGAGTNLGNFSGAPGGQRGAVNASSRFMRSGRQPGDFVGSDSGDQGRFVGSVQARARRARTPMTITPRPEPNVNQTAPAETNSAQGLYPPRYTLDDALTGWPPVEVESVLRQRLGNSRGIRWTSSPAVSVEGRTAILRGSVSSTKDRALAELLARLEPGISDVQNDLIVRPATEPSETAPLGIEAEEVPPPKPALHSREF